MSRIKGYGSNCLESKIKAFRVTHKKIMPENAAINVQLPAKAAIMGDARGMVKIVAEKGSLRILGVHICSPFSAEILQAGVLAVHHLLIVQDLIDATYIFPTLAEVLWVCARAFRREDVGNCPQKT